MQRYRKQQWLVINAALLLALIFIGYFVLGDVGHSGSTRVIDADTIVVDGKRFRLSGIDAPESKQTCTLKKTGKIWPCGRKATEALREKIKGEAVRCEGDNQDAYGRTLAVCYKGRENLNEWLVRNGWALAYTRYSNEYLSAQNKAENQGLGIWQSEFIKPEVWRRNN